MPQKKKQKKKSKSAKKWDKIFEENAQRQIEWENRRMEIKNQIKDGTWEPPSPESKVTKSDSLMKAPEYKAPTRNLNYDWHTLKPPNANSASVPSLSRLCARVLAFYIEVVPTLENIPWSTGGNPIQEYMRTLYKPVTPHALTLLSTEYPQYTSQNRILNLSNHRLDPPTLTRLSSPTSPLPTLLTHLSLHNTTLDDSQSLFISRLQNLTHLDLSHTKITDTTITNFSRSITYSSPSSLSNRGLHSLKYLNLRFTSITSLSLTPLSRFPSLVGLDLSDTAIQRDTLIPWIRSASWILVPPDVLLFSRPKSKGRNPWVTRGLDESHDCEAFRALHPDVRDVVRGASEGLGRGGGGGGGEEAGERNE
ncbi:hypothetical protein HK097_009751, partial [Rhizophlyctis rosea]